jgi:hypothetical protein
MGDAGRGSIPPAENSQKPSTALAATVTNATPAFAELPRLRTGTAGSTRGAAAEAMSPSINRDETSIGRSASETSGEAWGAAAGAGAVGLAAQAADAARCTDAPGRRAERARGGAAGVGRAGAAAGHGAGAGGRIAGGAGGVGPAACCTGGGSREAAIASRLESPGETASSSASAACAPSVSPRLRASCASATARMARRPRTRPSNVDHAAGDTRPAGDGPGATGTGALERVAAAGAAARPWASG